MLHSAMIIVAIVIIPLAVAVHSVLAWAFALVSRPGLAREHLGALLRHRRAVLRASHWSSSSLPASGVATTWRPSSPSSTSFDSDTSWWRSVPCTST